MKYLDRIQIREEEQMELWEVERLGIKKKSFVAGYDDNDKPKFKKYRVDQHGCRMYDDDGTYIPRSERKKEWKNMWDKNKKNIQWKIQLEKEDQYNAQQR
jgi:hypothetical protein